MGELNLDSVERELPLMYQVATKVANFHGYQLKGVFGKGGLSYVFEASSGNGPVAIKILTKDSTDRGFHIGQEVTTQREVYSRITPNGNGHIPVAQVLGHNAHCTPGLPREYAVFSAWPNGSCLAGKTLGYSGIQTVVHDVGSVFGVVHGLGKLFNDAKRRNLYLTSSGAAVGDFGSVMEKGKIPPFLTLDYASPEQLADLPCFEKSDVFMLAQVLYRLATGLEVVNFSLQNGLNYGELKQTVLNQTETTFSPPNSVRDIRNHLDLYLPTSAADVVMSALEMSPDNRPTLGELIAGFEVSPSVAEEKPVSSPTSSGRSQLLDGHTFPAGWEMPSLNK